MPTQNNLSSLQSFIEQGNLNHLTFDDSTFTSSINEVFRQKFTLSLNELALFSIHFNRIPNVISEFDIHTKNMQNWLIENHQNDIVDFYYNKRFFEKSKKLDYDDLYFFLYDDLMVYIDNNMSQVRLLFKKTAIEKVNYIHSQIIKFKKRKAKHQPEISLLVHGMQGIETKSMNINKPKMNISDNYNDDFAEVHKIIYKRLTKKNDKGLVLLHGKPGTGKTSYIRYLIAQLKKDVIFIPPNMANSLTSPTLISVLIDNPNSVLVIEDAENIVVDREQDGNSPVSTLLNISDGLLADCLNMQIICSFNTDISKIDSALMRKGRLIAKYEFLELHTDKAQKLSNKLGYDTHITHPMSLTAIYNQNERDFQQISKSKTIGFHAV